MTEIKELLKLGADSMKNQTFYKLLKDDKEYCRQSEKVNHAWKAVEELKLTEQQRSVIETYAARKDEAEYHTVVNAYMAGILDGYQILKMFDLTKE